MCDPAFAHSRGHCNRCQAEPKLSSPGPWLGHSYALGVEFGSGSPSHLWRWASLAPIVGEVGKMPLYFEARDLVTIFWQREKNALLYLALAAGWEREGRLSERCIEPQSAMVLNIQLISFHTTEPFFHNDKCYHLG